MQSLLSAPSVSFREMAVNMSNNAVRFYRERRYDDALIMYRNCIGFIYQATLVARERDTDDESHCLDFCRVREFFEPILIPADEKDNIKPRINDEVASVAIMYNLFLLLRTTGQTADALQILELAQEVIDECSSKFTNNWHPSLRLAINFHRGAISYESKKYDESWKSYGRAIATGKRYLPRDVLYANLCSRVGFALVEASFCEDAQLYFDEAITTYNLASGFDCVQDNVPFKPHSAAAA